eukprot:TRINITY_DN2905_c0_g1_i1.p2 TRINITY_DN2905_c0_g1~~TRINITY_DN2905_c0_g1_i1.p2  ORF type:complete len:145 (+),score=37.68 TRINITY_DN2905_c0_g1_i1:379-813(+)
MVTAFGAASSVASDTMKDVSHHFTLGADLVMFAALIAFVAAKTPRERLGEKPFAGGARRWLPLVLVSLGCALVMVDVTRHVLNDHGGVIAPEESLSMYVGAGHSKLSRLGRFCQVSTISGVLFMLLGQALLLKGGKALTDGGIV